MCVMVLLWRSKDNVGVGSLLYRGALGIELMSPGLCCKLFYLLSYLANPFLLVFNVHFSLVEW